MTQTSSTPEPSVSPEAPQTSKLKFPTAFTVLAAVLVLVWVASFFVPAGAYKLDPKTAGPVARHLSRAPVVFERGG